MYFVAPQADNNPHKPPRWRQQAPEWQPVLRWRDILTPTCTAGAASMYYLKVLLFFPGSSLASFSSRDPNGAAQITAVSRGSRGEADQWANRLKRDKRVLLLKQGVDDNVASSKNGDK